MIFADMGTGEYAPVEIDHKLHDHQAIGEGPGTVSLRDTAPLKTTRTYTSPLDSTRTYTSPIEPTSSYNYPTKPARPYSELQPLSTDTRVFTQPTSTRPQPLPDATAPPITCPPGYRYEAGAGKQPDGCVPLPPGSVVPTPPAQFLPDVKQAGSNVKWAVIGGVVALGIIGALVILR